MKAAPKRRHEAEVSCDPPIDSTNGVNADVAAEAPLDVSQNHLKPPKQSRDPRHKMDYAIFVIDEVYDARKAEQLGELLKQTLNELFDHYSLLSGVSQGEPNISSQSNPSKDENDELDLFAYSKCKYKRKRTESVFSEGKSELENVTIRRCICKMPTAREGMICLTWIILMDESF
ncbi:hypothetical protein V6N13_071029 [Hibiscus sabdariffa]